jgi:hypothetical protein
MGFLFNVKVSQEEDGVKVKIFSRISRILTLLVLGMFVFIGGIFLILEYVTSEGNFTINPIIPIALVLFFTWMLWSSFSSNVIIKKDKQTNQINVKKYFLVKISEKILDMNKELSIETSLVGPLSIYGRKVVFKNNKESYTVNLLNISKYHFIPLSKKDIQKLGEALGISIKEDEEENTISSIRKSLFPQEFSKFQP